MKNDTWPTPTTQEIEHPNAELTATGRRKSKDGKSSHSLNLADQVNMWPTPRVSDTEGGVVKNVEKKNDSYSRVNKKGVRFGVKLRDAVGYEEEKLWPTPIASSSQSASMDASKKEAERLHPKGQNHLAAEMASRTWPTPSTRDYKGGHGTIVEEDGKYYRVSNTTGTKYGARLDAQVEKMEADRTWPTPRASTAMSESIDNVKRRGRDKGNLEEKIAQETWPTPTTRDYKGGRKFETLEKSGRNENNSLPDKVNAENKKTAALNPDWVEWLMGYAPGYTDPEYTEPMHLEDHLGFESEPDIPRVTTRKEHRVNRLKCLGNSIVPQIMYEIGNAILADHQSEHKK